jgi:prepilin-type N-terminal cleavage/methylation domain-containing protein
MKGGFTIVELLIVVVVIGVLAAVTVVAFGNVQSRARDAGRISDLKSIAKALENHKTNTGSYPNEVGTVNASGWEVSHDGTGATNFLSALVSTGVVGKVPVDPKNNAVNGGVGTLNPGRGSSNTVYYYHLYPAGSNGCDATRGDFYVLGVTRMDTVASGSNHPQNPGFGTGCSTDWSSGGAWQTGAYTIR